jgi:uncharacterized damage-inducible protein DinB
MTISEALLADFQAEVGRTRAVLQAVPEDRLDWKPDDKSMSLGRLAGHIAESPAWTHLMMEDETDFSAGDSQPYEAASRSDLMSTFEQHVTSFRQLLAGRDDAFLHGTWTARAGDKVIMSMKRHVAVRSTAIHHTIHHRGQLSVYLRLLGVPVPQTYGPTADNPVFG